MTSAKRIAANRRNALKSTGPKTAEGKARSSRNATTHGLTAAVPRFEAGLDEADVATEFERWVEELDPEGDEQRAAVERAYLASRRLKQCARHEDEVTALRARDAARQYAIEEERKATDLGRTLFLGLFETASGRDKAGTYEIDPAVIVSELESTAEGVNWLLARWAELAAALDRHRRWQEPDALQAVRLLGRRPEEGRLNRVVRAILDAARTPAPETRESSEDVREANVRATLGAILAGEVRRLTDLKASGLDALAALDQAEAADRAMFADPRAAALRLRYESASSRELLRSLGELARLKKANRVDSSRPTKSARSRTSADPRSAHVDTQNGRDPVRRNEPNEAPPPREVWTCPGDSRPLLGTPTASQGSPDGFLRNEPNRTAIPLRVGLLPAVPGQPPVVPICPKDGPVTALRNEPNGPPLSHRVASQRDEPNGPTPAHQVEPQRNEPNGVTPALRPGPLRNEPNGPTLSQRISLTPGQQGSPNRTLTGPRNAPKASPRNEPIPQTPPRIRLTGERLKRALAKRRSR